MKEFIEKNKLKLLLIWFFIIFGIVFFSYNIILTWDSSEYIGMAEVIGTENMKSVWLGHRGLSFPLLLRIFLTLGHNKYSLLIMLYIFYILMVIGIIKIFTKLKEIQFLNSKVSKLVFFFPVFILIILNPIIFGYYHTILTEFVAMTFSIFISYICFCMIDLNWKENKKQIILYTLILSFMAIFIYHVKQSLIPIVLVSMLVTSAISLLEHWNIENILIKLASILFVGIMVISSVIIWNKSMSEANVAEKTDQLRVKNKLITSITELKEVSSNENIEEFNIEQTDISNKEKEEIKKIQLGNSNYKGYKIYKNKEDNYFVYFTKNNYSNLEQLKFYMKILVSSPKDIIKSYSENYYKIIFGNTKYPIEYFRENYFIPIRLFIPISNVIDLNPEYERYISHYRTDMTEFNNLSKLYTVIEKPMFSKITVFTKCNVYLLPLLIVILIFVYVFFRKRMSSTNKKAIQLMLTLYAINYGSTMSYVVFLNLVDRYIIPTLPLTYIADIILIILILKTILEKVHKKAKKVKNKH